MFLINTVSASISLRFSIKAPCPPGLKSSEPSFSRKGVLSALAAMVSVLGFCSEKEMLNFTPYFSSYPLAFSATLALKSSRWSCDTVKCTLASPLLLAYKAASTKCSSMGVRTSPLP